MGWRSALASPACVPCLLAFRLGCAPALPAAVIVRSALRHSLIWSKGIPALLSATVPRLSCQRLAGFHPPDRWKSCAWACKWCPPSPIPYPSRVDRRGGMLRGVKAVPGGVPRFLRPRVGGGVSAQSSQPGRACGFRRGVVSCPSARNDLLRRRGVFTRSGKCGWNVVFCWQGTRS